MFLGEPKSWVGKSAPRFLTSVCAWGLSLFLLAVAGSARAIADDAKKAEKEKPEAGAAEKEAPAERRVFLVNVPLPIVDQVDAKVIAQITALLPSEANAGAQRPLVVLQFLPSQDALARSDFGRSMNLARFLTGPKLAGVQTVAFLPGATTGHAVLPVLACEQLIVGREGALGPADPVGDAALAEDYRRLAAGRLLVPPALAGAFIDGSSSIIRVTTQNGVLFETEAETANLRQAGKVIEERSVFPERKPLSLSGNELRELGLSSHLADTLPEVETALAVKTGSLTRIQAPTGGFQPVMVDLHGHIHRRAVRRAMNAIEHYKQHNTLNVLFLNVDSRGGDLAEVLRLANYLATDLGKDCKCVLVVHHQIRGSTLALMTAVDEIVVTRGTEIGDIQEADSVIADASAMREGCEQLSKLKMRNWSLPVALMDSQTQVFQFRHSVTGETRYVSQAEANTFPGNRELWTREDTPIVLDQGISGDRAVELNLARGVIANLDDLKVMYGLTEPPKMLRPNWALEFIERLADPRLAGLLMFIGIFAIWIEFNTPGVGVPGFVGGVCLLLFFWSQFLQGNAGWLEGLLFLVGVLFVVLEVAVLPGLGIFGIGGTLMIVLSIILASQTFIVPQNAYQMRQLPVSMSIVIAAAAGGLAAIYVVHRYLPHTPYLNRLLLQAPTGSELAEQMQREVVSNWEHLLGKEGRTTTLLVPAGKAQFGKEVVDVMSEGEMVERGQAVVVTLVSGNRIVVRPV